MAQKISSKPRFFQRVLRWGWESKLLNDKSKMSLYPPFLLMSARFTEIGNGWRKVKATLPLTSWSRNPGGVIFGGFQAALADPVPALACSRLFPGYDCWTRGLAIDFKRGGDTDLELRFHFASDQELAIKQELEEKGYATPTFSYGFYLSDGSLASSVTNTVAIRQPGHISKHVGRRK